MNPAQPRANPTDSPCHIQSDASRVTAWSTDRIPLEFEPEDWRRKLRDDLRTAIAGFPFGEGKTLYAAYRFPFEERADVENLLIYNIFDDRLSQATRDRLVFERFYLAARDCPVPLPGGVLRQYDYRLVDDKPSSPHGPSGRALASLRFDMPGRVPESLASVWYAAKEASIDVVGRPHLKKPWGISLVMGAPSSSGITCSNTVKTLVDGITCALHCHDGSDIKELGDRVRSGLGLGDGKSLNGLLLDGTNAIFGKVKLLHCHGQHGVQWNPQDEYCVYCSLMCHYNPDSTRLEVGAQVFDMADRKGAWPVFLRGGPARIVRH